MLVIALKSLQYILQLADAVAILGLTCQDRLKLLSQDSPGHLGSGIPRAASFKGLQKGGKNRRNQVELPSPETLHDSPTCGKLLFKERRQPSYLSVANISIAFPPKNAENGDPKVLKSGWPEEFRVSVDFQSGKFQKIKFGDPSSRDGGGDFLGGGNENGQS